MGGNGYVGRALHDELRKRDVDVVVIGRNMSVDKYIKSNDIVFYLATENKSNKKIDHWKVNVLGLKKIVKICSQIKVKKLVYLSTIMVFKNGQIRDSVTNNLYVDSKVEGLKFFLKHQNKNFFVVYPGVVLNRDFRYQRKVVGILNNIKNKLGFFTQGGLMMMIGDKHRLVKYIFIDELVKILLNLNDRVSEVMAVTHTLTVQDYVKVASKTTNFWPFRIPLFGMKSKFFVDY
ncbi:MAG: NAD-dependent epimerase/dehydratase family protein [Candidatus Shapirobacteria bacterium]